MVATADLKRFLLNWFPESVISEVTVEFRVLLLTRLPNLVLPWRWAQLQRMRQQTGVKLNIGCGPVLTEGWTGIDYRSPVADARCDIKRGLPFQDGSCRYIFCEHVFEHLDLRELRRVLRECHRVLAPGGVLRIIMPDLAAYVRAYVENDHAFCQSLYQTSLPRAAMLNKVFRATTHRFIHDYASIEAELLAAGFSSVYQSAFRQSAFPELNIDLDLPHRIMESLYVEAVR